MLLIEFFDTFSLSTAVPFFYTDGLFFKGTSAWMRKSKTTTYSKRVILHHIFIFKFCASRHFFYSNCKETISLHYFYLNCRVLREYRIYSIRDFNLNSRKKAQVIYIWNSPRITMGKFIETEVYIIELVDQI